MVEVISTVSQRERDRVEFWQENASRMFLKLRTEQIGHGPFFGELACHEVANIPVIQLHASSQAVIRGRHEIANASDERYFICIQLAGHCTIRTQRHEFTSEPGDVELLDGRYTGELCFSSEYRRIVIPIPHNALQPRLANVDWEKRIVVNGNGGIGALASSYLRAFAENRISEPVMGPASEILLELLAVMFNSTVVEMATDAPSVREAQRHQIRAYVERNLSDPALSPGTVASHFRMSTRYLHGLFAEGSETFMRGVLTRRLQHARDDLSNPKMRNRSITEIAFACGFQDLSHFGRAFRAAFGATPRDYRMAATSGHGIDHIAPDLRRHSKS